MTLILATYNTRMCPINQHFILNTNPFKVNFLIETQSFISIRLQSSVILPCHCLSCGYYQEFLLMVNYGSLFQWKRFRGGQIALFSASAVLSSLPPLLGCQFIWFLLACLSCSPSSRHGEGHSSHLGPVVQTRHSIHSDPLGLGGGGAIDNSLSAGSQFVHFWN